MTKSDHKNPSSICPKKFWIDMEEASSLVGVGMSTLKRYCAERRIHPCCGRKMGGRWKFRLDIILEKGLVLITDEDAPPLQD